MTSPGKLIAAYGMTAKADARRALDQIQGELERINPSAARSLEDKEIPQLLSALANHGIKKRVASAARTA
jgi:hypothetical protein